MGDGSENESEVEKLVKRWRSEAAHFEKCRRDTLACMYRNCAKELERALREDGR